MKKILRTSLLAVAACFLFQTASFAQNNMKFGIGLAYDGEVENVGIQANLVYPVSNKIAVVPSLSYYFVDEDVYGIDNYFAVNVDGHLRLATDPEYLFYALGGLNLTSVGYDAPNDDPDFDDSETELGINLGVGGEYYLNSFALFGDLKYVIGGFDRVVLAIGARFPL